MMQAALQNISGCTLLGRLGGVKAAHGCIQASVSSSAVHLDSGLKDFLTAHHSRVHAGEKPYSSYTPVDLRKRFNEKFYASKRDDDLPAVGDVVEKTIETADGHPLRLRIYSPANSGQRNSSDKIPGLMYFHGGGFVIRDDMEVYDRTCRRMCRDAECIVVAVNYRLAPESPFPAAPEDCYAATMWVLGHGQELLGLDTQRFGVWGESCGGNLAAVVPAMIRDRLKSEQHPLKAQIIISPMLADNFQTKSYREKGKGDYVLTEDTMRWFWGHYVSHALNDCRSNPYCMPLRQATETAFRDLPKALVVSAEEDPLCDDGSEYAEKLKAAGVDSEFHCYSSTIHGFLEMVHISPSAEEAFRGITEWATTVLRE